MDSSSHSERVLLGALMLLVALIGAGLAVMVAAGVLGEAHHQAGARQSPPEQGSVPPERHVGSVPNGGL
jgi:hypothetical protein